jgi:ketosteroid isomerase-like protein
METEILKEVYAAINRNDIPAALKNFDPQIERIEPEGFATGGTYRGLAEVKAHLSQGRGTWAEGTCEPEEFIAAGDKVVVFLYVHVRLKNKTEWIEGRFADGFIFRNDMIIQMRTFAERQEALDWAGFK